MPNAGFGLFKARRKSSANVFDEAEADASPPRDLSPTADQGGFRVMTKTEVSAKKEQALKKAQEKEKPKFGRFSGFGAAGKPGRNLPNDDDSGSSSKRDSKSSSGTQFSANRSSNVNQFGSTSTLPSSLEADPNDNIFANLPQRPQVAQHSSSPSGLSITTMSKQLPQVPRPKTFETSTSSRYYSHDDNAVSPYADTKRSRAMTTSSYASTAIPPRVDTDFDFGVDSMDDLFSDLDNRRDSPDYASDNHGRSLLGANRLGQSDSMIIDSKTDTKLRESWHSRGSAEHLISSPVDNPISPSSEDRNSPPPPVPPHKYAPIASRSPDPTGADGFEDRDAKLVRQSVMARRSTHENSPERKSVHPSTSAAAPTQTPLTSQSVLNTTAPRAALHVAAAPMANDDDDDNIFATPTPKDTRARKPTAPAHRQQTPPPASTSPGESHRRVMTAAEFRAQQARQMSQPLDDGSDSEDYEDEEEAIRQREQEELERRKKQQQMQMAREALRRSTTAPADPSRPPSIAGNLTNGFPSEVSLQADQWDDEDVPLGVLAQHGFPNRNRAPTQPANARASYFRSSTMGLPERPASAGAASNRASAYMPPFARHLPNDPHSSFIGGGLVHQGNRESMGFNRAASVYGEPVGGSLPYAMESQQQFPTLVSQIEMKESSRPKYMGGATSKKSDGHYAGAMGAQMNGMNQRPNRMSQMPMHGMMGMNPMMNGMGGGMPMGMMGMGQMGYPMPNQNDLMQLQQLLAAQQMQIAQLQAQNPQAMYGQHMPQDPRMSMGPQQMLGPQNNNFLTVGNGTPPQHRPMSVISTGINQPQQQQQRPYSTPSIFGGGIAVPMGPNAGYTPSIAPSERSNIGLSARYRPVVTSNGSQDHMSSISSTTLQASSGAATDSKKVKGIIKTKVVPQVTVREDDEDDWGKMKARKSKFFLGKKEDSSSLLF